MKNTLEKLMQEAGERLKKLEKEKDELESTVNTLHNRRAKLHAIVTKSTPSLVNKVDLCEAVERLQALKEQLAINRDNLMEQQKYVVTLADKYMELVKIENAAPAKNYSSDADESRFFPKNRHYVSGL